MSSTTKRTTKRRDDDPVRVYADGRLAFWTSGVPGQGVRRYSRFKSVAEAEEVAAGLRVQLRARATHGVRTSQSLNEVFAHMREHWVAGSGKTVTIRQYASNWNVWVPEAVGEVACDQVAITHWSTIFAAMNADGASVATIRAVARTLNAVIKHGILNGFFANENAFGLPTQRKDVVATSIKRAGTGGGPSKITPNMCPKVDDVERLAESFEQVYPGYGRRLVLLAFASGLRFAELLALKEDSIELATGIVHVDAQLDRLRPWPSTRLPKYDKTRVSVMWTAYADVAESLVADASDADRHDAGWLFPRHRSVRGWLEQAGNLSRAARQDAEWEWDFHFLRHAYATLSLAPPSSGGYGLNQKSVSVWLGHADLSTTLDMYVAEQSDAAAVAAALTRNPPGLVLPSA